MMEQESKLAKLKKAYNSQKMSTEQEDILRSKIEQAKMEKRRADRRTTVKKWSAVAACAAVLVLLPNTSMSAAHAMSRIPLFGRLVEVVTFRNYNYEDERNSAQIQVPELMVSSVMEKSSETDKGKAEAVQQSLTAVVQQNLENTVDEINARIQEIAGQMIREFESNLDKEWGYQDVLVKSEIINATQNYFTLKLICYQGAGSGSQWNYFYTVDLNTGKLLKLADLFEENADFITPISEDIKRQMRERMAADEMQKYWLDDPEVAFWEFTGITEEASFYINESNEIVICFNEGDVAPMYMGCPEFAIPAEVVKDIRCR